MGAGMQHGRVRWRAFKDILKPGNQTGLAASAQEFDAYAAMASALS